MGSLEIKPDEVQPVDLTARSRLIDPVQSTNPTLALKAILAELETITDGVNAIVPRVIAVCDAFLEDDCSGISMADIIKCVSDYHCLTSRDIRSHRRDSKVVMPRHIAMYLCRMLTTRSLPQIGAFFGGRDHTTALHAIRKITALVEQGGEIATRVERLTKKLCDRSKF